MELLDRYAMELPTRCRITIELHEMGSETVDAMKATTPSSARSDREQGVRDLLACYAVISRRVAVLLTDIDKLFQDLVAFVPLWLEAVEKRRALLLKRSLEEKGHSMPFPGPGLDIDSDELDHLLG